MTKRRRKPPEILKCERCGTWFAVYRSLPACTCPNGPDVSQWANENGYGRPLIEVLAKDDE